MFKVDEEVWLLGHPAEVARGRRKVTIRGVKGATDTYPYSVEFADGRLLALVAERELERIDPLELLAEVHR